MITMRLLTLFLVISYFFVSPVFASSDVSYCNFSLSITNKNNYSTCNNLPFINPFNDSRTNLILLTDSQTAQQATLRTISSPQNQIPYLPNDIRKNISTVPFELTTYSAYYNDKLKTHKEKLNALQESFDSPTKSFISKIKNAYINSVKTNQNKTSNEQCNNCLPSDTLATLNYIAKLFKTTNISDKEKYNLALARYTLHMEESKAYLTQYIPDAPSDEAKPFVNYLLGVEAFHKANYIVAVNFFTNASQGSQPWIKEAATYMIARTLLNQGQATGYDNWGFLDLAKVDQITITRSRVAFENYLKSYPNGIYVNSSKGLLRRIYWLQDNQQALVNAYENLLEDPNLYHSSTTSIENSIADLIIEIDNKIYFADTPFPISSLTQTPKLLTVYDLIKMRSAKNNITLADLLAQKPTFLESPKLYKYLLASYYTYVEADPEKVLTLIDELDTELTSISYFQLSEQVLRIIALETQKKWDTAEQLWLSLKNRAKEPYQASFIELGLALNYEKSGQIAKIFAKNSPITTPQLRYIVLRKNTDRNLLKLLVVDEHLSSTDKASIIYLILYKDLLSKHYDDFLEDSSLLITDNKLETTTLHDVSKAKNETLELFSNPIPNHEEYSCPSPIILANVLKNHPQNAKALNCLGEFSDYYRLPYTNYMLNNYNTASEALGTNKPTEFGKNLHLRLEGYQQVINDPDAPEDDKAYALYKAIRCFANSGYNRCDGRDIPQAERKKWFRLLQSTYSKTSWAKLQKIYW